MTMAILTTNTSKFPGTVTSSVSRPAAPPKGGLSDDDASTSAAGSSAPSKSAQPSAVDNFQRYLDSPALLPSGFAEYIFPGISMTDIANSTGLTIGGVSRIFNGKRKARRHTLVSIANIYTDGSVEKLEAVIRARVIKIVGREKLEMEDRNNRIRRVR